MSTSQDTPKPAEDLDRSSTEWPYLRRMLLISGPILLLVWLALPNIGPVLRPFNTPSQSMAPTLKLGSTFMVSRAAYGYSRYSFDWFDLPMSGRFPQLGPARGDVVAFRLPRDRKTVYVKRVIGLPGDEVQMREGVLVLNGQPVPKRRLPDWSQSGSAPSPRFEETLPNGVTYQVLDVEANGPLDNTPLFKVPPGHYFVMGDNRDNSNDSRNQTAGAAGFGTIPAENLIGRALL